MPWQEVRGLAPALGVITKVVLHVGHQLPVDPYSILGRQAELPPLLDLLKDPGLDQGPSACHDGKEAAAAHPIPCLHAA